MRGFLLLEGRKKDVCSPRVESARDALSSDTLTTPGIVVAAAARSDSDEDPLAARGGSG